jgi:surface carbohydrate biosynthesis protein (TIGR04326 family)
MKETDRTLLVVTGVIPREAFSQLKLLHEASQQRGLEKYKRILIKPHQGFALDLTLAKLAPEFNYDVVTGSVSDYWSRVDVVYCANSSGASLEAAWLGIPLIVTSAIDSMNLNPLFGFKGLNFVANASQLMEALEKPDTTEIPDDYFFLDEKLKSWRRILEL